MFESLPLHKRITNTKCHSIAVGLLNELTITERHQKGRKQHKEMRKLTNAKTRKCGNKKTRNEFTITLQ